MADRIYSVDSQPSDTVVVEKETDDRPVRSSHTGVIIALIILAIILLIIFVGRPFGGGGGSPGANVPTTVPTAQ